MCGIIGYVNPGLGKTDQRKHNFLAQGLVVDSLRGTSGTGIGLVKDDLTIESFKKAIPGPDFVQTTVSELAFKAIDTAVIAIGHNRAATIGSTKNRNCHPFVMKDKREILLVHNGTLHNYTRLTPSTFNHEVDSAHAAMAIATSDDVAKTLKDITGPFVFVWWDGTEKTFNIARNNMRDIYYIRDKQGNLYFGSEYKMVDWLLGRNGIELPERAVFNYPSDFEWCSWRMEGETLAAKPEVIDITPAPKPVSSRGFVQPQYPSWGGNTPADKWLKDLTLASGDLIQVKFEELELYNQSITTANEDHVYGKIIARAYLEKDSPEVWIHSINPPKYRVMNKHFGESCPVRVVRASNIEYGSRDPHYVITADFRSSDILREMKRRKAAKDEKKEIKTMLNSGVLPGIGGRVDEEEEEGEDFVVGPGRVFVPVSDFKKVVAHGCAYCTEVPGEDDASSLMWLPNYSPPAFLCKKCSIDEEIKDLALTCSDVDKVKESKKS